jgi:hypothetical protein
MHVLSNDRLITSFMFFCLRVSGARLPGMPLLPLYTVLSDGSEGYGAELSSLAAVFESCLAVISAILTSSESAAAIAHLCLALAVFGLSLRLVSFVLDTFAFSCFSCSL